ncbi:NUDIX hydrolase [Cryptosporangium phraense]|uniref:NUDIX domain-containing protein n=1 Tax=Cryptosporangium phraense TaxID=2593070 RepID=A0A545AFI8_9ACTN|nr:NUDIX domain-containing protein [Cryptosporangium phraense]TQS40106.1 NUDIX domain-containing protein [Cryptosporangium phraense]
MPIPDFIVELRSKIGRDPLPLTGVTAVVLDDRDRVLLTRRSDDGTWALVTGCLEPGEQPAVCAVRETLEETAVVAEVERLVSVEGLPLRVLPNGDQVYWLDVAFRCRYVSGEARVNDDESVDVAWFDAESMPPLDPRQTRCLALAREAAREPWYVS